MKIVRIRKEKEKGEEGAKKAGIKVVYISSPMKVKTCASNFRALVQELTGKDSDAASRLNLDVNGGAVAEVGGERVAAPPISENSLSYYSQEESFSPSLSDSVFDTAPFEDMEGSFLGMFGGANSLSQLEAWMQVPLN